MNILFSPKPLAILLLRHDKGLPEEAGRVYLVDWKKEKNKHLRGVDVCSSKKDATAMREVFNPDFAIEFYCKIWV